MSAPKPQPPTKRVPAGPALAWTDAELGRLSAVTPDDAQQAADWWRRNAPAEYAGLLDAVLDDRDGGA